MPKPILSKLKTLFPDLLLGLVALVIAIIHFKSGLWLTGWDNLHPEFNFWLNIKRSFFSVWQEYQGLGLLAGMAHAADLPRQLFLFFLSWFIPIKYLRFVSSFLMLPLGAIGASRLAKELLPDESKARKNGLAAFLGGLSYLLNLNTVQVFYVPFETFTAFYGFLPWLLFLVVRFFKKPTRRNLLFLFLISLVSTTAWYVPTLFVVYLLSLGVLSLGQLIGKKSWQTVEVSLVVLATTLVANAFWLLPYGYFVANSVAVVGQAHQNFMTTEDIYLRNKEFGKFKDVALLKGFWFKFVDWDVGGELRYMNEPWRHHLALPPIEVLGYFLFAVVGLGIVYQLLKRQRFWLAIILWFLLPFTMLANDTPVFSSIDGWLYQNLPIFNQVFRVPFTKFGTPAALAYSLLFAFGSYWLIKRAEKLQRAVRPLVALTLTIALVVFSWPIFRGKLLYEYNQLDIPKEYFELMEFFRSQDPNTRVANFPQYTYVGWNYYRWRLTGSGFLWYGVEQPILDRAFDGFSRQNEAYYWELSQAIYSQNLDQLEAIFEKYQIKWLVLDKSVRSYGNYQGLYLEKLEEMFSHSRQINLVKNWDFLKVYQVNSALPIRDYIILAKVLSNLGPESRWLESDAAYANTGFYMTTETNGFDEIYPFRSLFSGRQQSELEFAVVDDKSTLSFIKPLGLSLEQYRLATPSANFLASEDLLIKPSEALRVLPTIELIDKNIKVTVAKDSSVLSYDSLMDKQFFNQGFKNCNPLNQGEIKRKVIERDSEQVMELYSLASNNCLVLDLPNLPHQLGYLIKIKSGYVKGKGILFYILDKTAKKPILETYLPKSAGLKESFFVVPSLSSYGRGYSLYFDNISIGNEETINNLGRVQVFPIPYDYMKQIRLEKNDDGSRQAKLIDDFQVLKSGTWFYQIVLPQDRIDYETTLVLSQAHHLGWKAFYFDGLKPVLLEHVLVNNWANGWRLAPTNNQQLTTNNIYIFFWPQLLEFIGFGMLSGLGIWLWREKVQ